MNKLLITILSLVLFIFQINANTYKNPILKGGYPDPSICENKGYYYLVNSSFEYFPGLPLHRSKDLVNWVLVGYALDRGSQVSSKVNLIDVQSNGGVHAPSLRCHDDKFYIISTNVYYDEATNKTEFVNFLLVADNFEGPWSDPIIIEDAPGIDPDIIFDDDGKIWYLGNRKPKNPAFEAEGEIWIQELDPKSFQLIGDSKSLWRGACNGDWAEGPHIYKNFGKYYLLIAEGGTSFNHSIMIAVSDNIDGPYISNPRNPILTSRHLSYDYWVNSVGHGDLLRLSNEKWYLTALGIRNHIDRTTNMGRETFLLPVIWEQEPFEWKQEKIHWPVISPNTGKTEKEYPLPYQDSKQLEQSEFTDTFDNDKLSLAWNFRRYPEKKFFSLNERLGFLRLYSTKKINNDRKNYSFLGVKQSENNFELSVDLNISDTNLETGLSLIQKDDNYINFLLKQDDKKSFLKVEVKERNEQSWINEKEIFINTDKIILKIIADSSDYYFSYSIDNGITFKSFTTTASNLILSNNSYTGAHIGLYINSLDNNQRFIDVDNFSIKYNYN